MCLWPSIMFSTCVLRQLLLASPPFTVAVSLLNSCITRARASGLIPDSHSLTHVARVSASKPVFNKRDISMRVSIVSRAAEGFFLDDDSAILL